MSPSCCSDESRRTGGGGNQFASAPGRTALAGLSRPLLATYGVHMGIEAEAGLALYRADAVVLPERVWGSEEAKSSSVVRVQLDESRMDRSTPALSPVRSTRARLLRVFDRWIKVAKKERTYRRAMDRRRWSIERDEGGGKVAGRVVSQPRTTRQTSSRPLRCSSGQRRGARGSPQDYPGRARPQSLGARRYLGRVDLGASGARELTSCPFHSIGVHAKGTYHSTSETSPRPMRSRLP